MPPAKKIVLIWTNLGPYHLARVAATQRLGRERGWEVGALELAGRAKTYPWIVQEQAGSPTTLFPEMAVEEVPSWISVRRAWEFFNGMQPDALAVCGYDSPVMLAALAWSKKHKKITILMSDSKADDQPRRSWKELLKRRLVRCYDAGLVAGSPHIEYAISLGMPPQRIFCGYDVVDNDGFAQGAAAARKREAQWRQRLNLPNPYFLTVSRLIKKKNLFRLIEAYKKYRSLSCFPPWDLVICGSGPLEKPLKDSAAGLPAIHFAGFKQIDELKAYYGLAGVGILASSHFEQWGLVVNEAMAAGLPVLVSRACGCARDLVQEGVNGFSFDPHDLEGLAGLMTEMSSGEVDLQALGEASRRLIADWHPEVFAENLFRAVETALAAGRAKK
jgi:1,2-diacylglycerol 3-alpha-glucosyltransferase